MASRPIIISIEGNIGSGKSTILDALEQYILGEGFVDRQIIFIKEPVDIWEKIRDSKTDENILQKFYTDQARYAFPFQVMAYATRLSMLRKAIRENPHCDVIVCERSLEADKNIFAKMLFDEGKIEDVNYQIYNHFYAEYEMEFGLSGIVYINSTAETSYERIAKRSRNGEGGIPLEYLQKCKDYHDTWLTSTETSVLSIDANSDVSYDISDPEDKGLPRLTKITGFIDVFCKERDEDKKQR
jgi:deoxycitidine kinase/deoxyguanosine kinase